MDADQVLFLSAHRLARVACGHQPSCGCMECEIIAKCLRADKGLRGAVAIVYDATGGGPYKQAAQVALDQLVGDIR